MTPSISISKTSKWPCLLLLLCLALPAHAQLVMPNSGATATYSGQIRTLNSRYYQIQTDLSDWAAKQVGEHLDAVSAAYAARFSKFPVRNNSLAPLYLFASRQDYLAFLQERGINGDNTGGMYFRSGERSGLVGWVENKNREKVLSVLRHEAFHQFTYERLGLRLPKWLNEGLATYFEDGIVGRNEIVTGLVSAQRLHKVQQDIRSNNCIPFEQLWNAQSSEWSQVVREDRQTASAIYNQSWAIVQFLIHGADGKYVGAFENYFQRIGQGEAPAAAFRSAFRLNSPAQLQDEWVRYMQGLGPDSLSLALEEMRNLAPGMELLHSEGIHVNTVDQLYAALIRYRIPHVPANKSVFGQDRNLSLRLKSAAEPGLPPDLVAGYGSQTVRLRWVVNQNGDPEPDIVAGAN